MGKYTFKPVVFDAERFVLENGTELKTQTKPPTGKSKKHVKTNGEFHAVGRELPIFLDVTGPFVRDDDGDKVRPGSWLLEADGRIIGCNAETFHRMYQPHKASSGLTVADKFRGHLLHGDN